MKAGLVHIDYKDKKVPIYYRPGTADEEVIKEIFQGGYYFKWGFPNGIEKGDVVVDLGAQIGTFSIQAAIAEASKVYAIEPFSYSFDLLKKNIGDFKQIEPIKAAVTGKKHNEDVRLNLTPSTVVNYLAEDLPIIPTASDIGTFEVVRGITLDGFIKDQKLEKIDFLKLDIEGSEYEIFRNLSDDGFSRIRKMSMEWHRGAPMFSLLLEYLLAKGFNVAWMEGDNERGKLQLAHKKSI